MQEIPAFKAHQPYALAMHFTADGATLITSGMDNLIKLWSTSDWSLKGTFEGHNRSANTLALSPDSKILVSGSSDFSMRIWSFPDGILLNTIQERKQPVGDVAFSQDGRSIASGWYGGWAAVHNLDGKRLAGFKASKRHIISVAFSPSAQTLATAGIGNEIKLWSLPDGKRIGSLIGHQFAAGWLKFLTDGHMISFGYDKQVIIWDMEDFFPLQTIPVEGEDPRGLVLSPDEQIAAIPMRRRVELRRISDWSLVETLPVSSKVVHGAIFSPDGKILVATGGDGKLRVFK